jgi:hypothetical protein
METLGMMVAIAAFIGMVVALVMSGGRARRGP